MSVSGATVLIGLATLVTAVVLVAFSVDTRRNAPETFLAMILIGVVAVVFDAGEGQDVGASGPA